MSSFLLFDKPQSPTPCLIYMDQSSRRARCRRDCRAPFGYSRFTVYRTNCGEIPTRAMPVVRFPWELLEHTMFASNGCFDQRDSANERG